MSSTQKEQDRSITWHSSAISKQHRHKQHHHKSVVVWLTGLSGSGKSTLANAVDEVLYQQGSFSYVLDGDNIRHGLNSDLGFAEQDRKENIRRIGEVAKLFVDAGCIVLTAFISPYREDRSKVRAILEEGEFLEVFVKCSLEECVHRDPKGLYRKAQQGLIQQFTGVDAPYEQPDAPDVIVDTEKENIQQSVEKIMNVLSQHLMLDTQKVDGSANREGQH